MYLEEDITNCPWPEPTKGRAGVFWYAGSNRFDCNHNYDM